MPPCTAPAVLEFPDGGSWHPFQVQFLKNSGWMPLLAVWTMIATVVITIGRMAESAAAGIAKFHRGRAGFTVVWGARAVPVLLATRAGV
jgi:hypothetical protein